MSGSRLPYDQVPSDSDSSTSSSSLDAGEDGEDFQGAIRRPPWTELEQLQHSINTYISGLYRISVVLRKNRNPLDRILKSAKIDTSFYEFFDERHVLEKFPTADPTLVSRLGRAVSRRRKYLKYREQHRHKLSQPWDVGSVSHDGKKTDRPVLGVDQKSSFIDIPAPSQLQPSGSRDSTTASTFYAQDILAWNVVENIDQLSEADTQSSHGSTSSVQQDQLNIPPPPVASLEGKEFECPYCYTICRFLSSESWQQRKEWRRHVLRDLQPYICTFGGCSEANTLFERRRDWIAHELQSHRNEWCCNTPGHQAYDSRKEFTSHMKRQHMGSVEMDRLDSLADMVARPALSMKFSCPLRCSEDFNDLSIDRLERHVGRHLEIIATFALPSSGTESRVSHGSTATRVAVLNDSTSSGTKESIDEDDGVDVSLASDIFSAFLQAPGGEVESSPKEVHSNLVFREYLNDLAREFESVCRGHRLPQDLPAMSVRVVSDAITPNFPHQLEFS